MLDVAPQRQSKRFGHTMGRTPKGGVCQNKMDKMTVSGFRKTVDKFFYKYKNNFLSVHQRDLLIWNMGKSISYQESPVIAHFFQ